MNMLPPNPFSVIPRLVNVLDKTVNVTRESTYREQNRRMRICFSNAPEPKWITADQLYDVLTNGEPGEYILRDASAAG